MMLVTKQSIANIVKIHKDDKFICMELPDTDGIIVNDYFDKLINLWSVVGLQDAAARAMRICALNTKEAKLGNKKSKEKVIKDESLDMVRLQMSNSLLLIDPILTREGPLAERCDIFMQRMTEWEQNKERRQRSLKNKR